MRLGIGSWTYAWSIGVPGFPRPAHPMTALDLLEKAREFGLSVVQIADNLPLDQLSRADLEQLKATADAWNIRIEAGTRGVQPDHLLRYLEIAHFLGATLLRTLTHRGDSQPDLSQAAAWIAEVLPRFQQAGVCLALENYERHSARELADLVRRIDSPWLGICLDTVNSLGGLETTEMVARELAPYVRCLHLKDFDIVRVEHRMGFSVVGRPAGEGRVNVEWLLEELRRAGSTPNMILELWTPYAGNIEDTVLREQEWAARSVRFLKRYAS